MSVESTVLENGLRVVTDSMSHLESASVGVWVDAGARYEAAEMHGAAHLLEHMAFKGTRRRDAQAIAEEIEAVGGHLNAYTGREHTAYFARVLKADVPLALDILADILQHSVFDPEELARERAVVVQEIGQAEDTPDDIIFDHLQETAFPGQPIGRSILGTVASVGAMDGEALRRFMGQHYRAPQMVLAAAGAVEHQALVRLAGEAFRELGPDREETLPPACYRGGDFREAKALEQVHIAMALPGLTYDDPDFYAAQVMATVLGGGMSSRLFQEVREKRGLCYSVFAFASSFVDDGMVGIYAGTGEDEIGELVPVICDELLKLTEDADEREVARARAQLKAGLLMSLESSGSRSEQLGRQTLIYGRPLVIDELVAKVEAVDAARVRAVGRRIAGAGKPAVAAMGPIGGLASYDEIAARFG
ncbi:MAG: pitrilysin family protein [Alphaproteobacteria bacterium]|nr:pitrilysin family protein [Alphaproteobacteria bacterium]